jgi:hypothetical protein
MMKTMLAAVLLVLPALAPVRESDPKPVTPRRRRNRLPRRQRVRHGRTGRRGSTKGSQRTAGSSRTPGTSGDGRGLPIRYIRERASGVPRAGKNLAGPSVAMRRE